MINLPVIPSSMQLVLKWDKDWLSFLKVNFRSAKQEAFLLLKVKAANFLISRGSNWIDLQDLFVERTESWIFLPFCSCCKPSKTQNLLHQFRERKLSSVDKENDGPLELFFVDFSKGRWTSGDLWRFTCFTSDRSWDKISSRRKGWIGDDVHHSWIICLGGPPCSGKLPILKPPDNFLVGHQPIRRDVLSQDVGFLFLEVTLRWFEIHNCSPYATEKTIINKKCSSIVTMIIKST